MDDWGLNELGADMDLEDTFIRQREMMNDIQREREMLRRERFLLEKEKELLEREKNLNATACEQASRFNDSPLISRDVAERLLPEFDPAKATGLTADRWVRRVEGVADAYGWDQSLLLAYVTTKLKGAARQWMDCNLEIVTSWDEFKLQLIRSFPSHMDQSAIHYALSKKKKARDETYEEYVYAMKSLAQRGDIRDESLLKYITNGLADRELVKVLAIQEIHTVEDFLQKVRRYEEIMNRERPMMQATAKAKVVTTSTTVVCYRCGKNGHIAKECRKTPKRKCFKCGSEDHLAKDCVSPRTSQKETERGNVRRVENVNEKLKDERYKPIEIDGKVMIGFVDIGSDVVTLRKDVADKNKIRYVQTNTDILKGFGNGSCNAVGKRNLLLKVDDVSLETEVIIVPEEAQEDAVILGKSALDQPGIVMVKELGKLTITRKEEIPQTEEPKIVRVKKLEPLRVEDIRIGSTVPEEQRKELVSLIQENRECFATNIKEVGKCNLLEMKIEMMDPEPIHQRPYRTPYSQREKMKEIVEELLEADIIVESTSDYSSPAILVGKKDNETRMCIDYRRLNAKIKKVQYPVPIMEEALDKLAGNKYFIKLDLASGYYQILIEPKSRHITAFVTNSGQYEFKYMPFGLATAPAVFAKMMDRLVKRMMPGDVVHYFDDILIPCRSLEEGMEKLRRVLQIIREVGITLKLKKCSFFDEKVEFLGHEVTQEGIRPLKEKIRAVQEFKKPASVHEVRQFCGLASFFRKYIENYAMIAKPITKLLHKNVEFIWQETQEKAFEEIKQKLSQRPVLVLYDPNKQHRIHTDASKWGLAGILLQEEMTEWKPVAYFSRQTTDAEARYHSYELEMLAVVETVDRFRNYLLGRPFTIYTDCNALKTTMSKKDIVPRIGRWCLKLLEYDFTLLYRPGEQMRHVDALSRQPVEDSKEMEIADINIFKVRIDTEDWLVTMQLQDPKLQLIREILNRRVETGEEKQIHKDYKVEEGRIFRKVGDSNKWVVPSSIKWRVVRDAHDEMGHYGEEKTLKILQRYYWFPRMKQYVKKYLKSCVECAYHKIPGGKREGELHNIPRVPVPFYVVHMDHLGPFPEGSGKNKYILAYIDNFTKYTVLKAVKDVGTKLAGKMVEDVINIFGTPKYLITDQGTAFSAKQFEDVCTENSITHIKNATATPRANGQVERLNRTILTAVTTMYKQEDGKDWDKNLKIIQWSINSMPNKTTGKTPHELLFGYHPRNALKNKLILALEEIQPTEETDALEILNENREYALSQIEKAQVSQKKRFDKARKAPTKYNVGDLVLVQRDAAASGQSRKLMPRYKGPYMVDVVLANDRYLLIDVPGAQRTQRSFRSVFAADKMKSWCRLEDNIDTEAEEDDPEEDDAEENAVGGDDQKEDEESYPGGRSREIEDDLNVRVAEL